ncbi:MAG: TetR/AcrR family transcriptional regulator [Lonepinella koalarum]|nr:TetR/AcrR family transcriptional regulator [Lonepinella koalarum]
MRHSETDNAMQEQIFVATERLMATEGLPNLSMHKIAKEACISAGTIYIYFKSKEDLLEQFAVRVFANFQYALAKDVDVTRCYFEQYRQMWKNIWHHLLDNPMILSNMHQYKSLPRFCDLCQDFEDKSYWAKFCQKAKQAEYLCDLPISVLFSLGLESAMKLAYNRVHFNDVLSEDMLENIIERTWRSIQK